jgi:Calcineurin-like phosphoesterase
VENFVTGTPDRIGVAGDWHGNTAWATRAIRKMASLLPPGPRVIVHLGDFGIWPGPDGHDYLTALTGALADADAELWFVDGNHEDFTELARLRPGPDGRSPVTDRIWHLPRGYRWRWHGREWLALGGAVSVDRALRTAGVDWWPEEEITWRQAGRSSTPGTPTSWSRTTARQAFRMRSLPRRVRGRRPTCGAPRRTMACSARSCLRSSRAG